MIKPKFANALKSFLGNNFDDELLAQINPNDINSFSIQRVNLIDLMDFGKTNFDKAINLSTESRVKITSKYPLVRLGTLLNTIETGSRPNGGVGNLNEGALSLGGEHIHNTNGIINLVNPKFVRH